MSDEIPRSRSVPSLDVLAHAANGLLEDVPAMVVITDADGRVRFMNGAAIDQFGDALAQRSAGEWPAHLGLKRSDGHVCAVDEFPPAAALGGATPSEIELAFPGGRVLAFSSRPIREVTGAVIGVMTCAHDLTESKRTARELEAERAWHAVQHRRQAALATIQQAVSEPNELNAALDRIVGLAATHLPSSASSIVLWDAATQSFAVSASSVPRQRGAATADRVRREGGATRWIVEHAEPLVVPDVAQDPFGANAMLSEEGLRAYAGVPLIDDGLVVGVLYALDTRCRDYTDDDVQFLVELARRATAAITKTRTYEQLRTLNDELAGHRVHLEQLVHERTTELRESLERLRAADRLASIGTLTAGLGHDINNILFPIRCRLETLDWKEVPADLADTLRAVAHAAEYLQHLSDGLRLFARDPNESDATSEVTDPSRWWEQVRTLLGRALPEHVDLVAVVPAAGLPGIPIAPHRLTQAVLNLVVNAGEAIDERGTVELRVEAGADRTVRLIVADDGQGMPAEMHDRIFEPFFTTKTRGMSTGLGLALVLGAVKAAAGAIDVTSTPGGGTTFTLTFPAVERDDGAPTAERPVRSGSAAVRLGDARVAAWTAHALQESGYEIDADPAAITPATQVLVIEAANGNLEAVRSFLEEDDGRRVVACGAAEPGWHRPRVDVVPSGVDVPSIRAAIARLGGD